MNRKFLIIALLLGCPFAVSADRDAERTALAKIKHELESLKPLIEEAKAQADRDARVQFQYDWLALDLKRISLGIQEHLLAPSTQPRSFPPLKGDYRQ
jgi:RAQPRD family integrative conjugative element protein